MFERFTDQARRVIILAQDEARKLSHQFIGTEHFLLGLLHEHSEGVAARALADLGIGYDAVLALVEQALGRGTEPTSGHVPFTADAKRAMEGSLRESIGRRHSYIGPEHLLLGLVRDENDATRMLADLGADAQRVRDQVLVLLD